MLSVRPLLRIRAMVASATDEPVIETNRACPFSRAGEIVVVTENVRGRDADLATVAASAEAALRLRPTAWANVADARAEDAAPIVLARDVALVIATTTAEVAVIVANLFCPFISAPVIEDSAVRLRNLTTTADAALIAADVADSTRPRALMVETAPNTALEALIVRLRTDTRTNAAVTAAVTEAVTSFCCPLVKAGEIELPALIERDAVNTFATAPNAAEFAERIRPLAFISARFAAADVGAEITRL